MSGFLYNSLYRSATLYRDKPALIFNDAACLTFTQFLHCADCCAAFLQAQGLKSGDMIYAALGSTQDFCALIYGASRLHITVIPVSTKLKQEGIAHLLSSIEPKAVFFMMKRNSHSSRSCCLHPVSVLPQARCILLQLHRLALTQNR